MYELFSACIEDFLPLGIIILDEDLNVIFWNKWLEINTGIRKEEILKRSILEVIPYTQKFRFYFQQALEGSAVILAQKLHKYIIPIKIKDTEFEYMQQTVQIFPYVKNEVVKGIAIVIEDVTSQVKREEDYKRQIRTLRILSEVQRSIFSLDFEECIENLFNGILKLVDSSLVYLFVLENGNLILKKSTSEIKGHLEIIENKSFIVQRALAQRESIYIPNKEEIEIKLLNKFAESGIAIPLLGKEEVLGVLLIEFYEWDPLKKNDILNLETIVMQGSILLESSRFLSLLRDSEARYRMFLEYSVVGIFMAEGDKVQYANPRLVEILGYPSYIEKLDDLLKYMFPEDRERFMERYRAVLERKLDHIIDEFKAKKVNGEDIYIEVSLVSVPYKFRYAVLGSVIDITHRKKLEEELEAISMTDPLTGIYNRRGFFILSEHNIALAKRLNRRVFVLFADLDNMKWINDYLGHNLGDQALIDVSNILKSTFRQNDIIARVGGDEFAVLGVCKDENDKEVIERKVRAVISEFNKTQEKPYSISLSIGIVVYDPNENIKLDDVLEEADKLMYEEKRRKKNIGETR